MDPKKLVAHRGYQALYPENTLLAYRQAIAAGALFLETDIQFSADMEPILYHDLKLKRVSGETGKTTDYPLRNLLQFSAHEPRRLGQCFIKETISPLSALVTELETYPQVSAYVEVKEEAVRFAGMDTAYAAISQCLAPVAGRCCLISYDYDFIHYARQAGWKQCGVVLKKWRDLDTAAVQATEPDTVFCNYKKIPRGQRLDQFGFAVVLFEIANTDTALRWLERGAAKIESFNIGALIGA